MSTKGQNKESGEDAKRENISLAPLEFEEVLEDLLKIKPVDNAELKKPEPKKRSKSKK